MEVLKSLYPEKNSFGSITRLGTKIMESEINKIAGNTVGTEKKDEYISSTSDVMSPVASNFSEKENDWNSRRRIYYIIGIVLIILSFIFYKLYPVIFPKPTCFDKKQNNIEGGVDCGGACELMCKNTFIPLEVKLAKAFNSGFDKDGDQKYDFLILLDNKNVKQSPKKLTLNIDIYGNNGEKLDSIIKEAKVTTYNKVPVLINDYVLPKSITDKSVTISKLFVSVQDNYDFYINLGYYNVSLLDYKFENSNTPKLEIEYTSPYKDVLNTDIDLLVILKDNLDNVVGYNTRKINTLIPERKEKTTFSWKQKIEENVLSVELIPLTYLFYTK